LTEIIEYGQRTGDGARNVGVDLDGVRLLVQPSSAKDNGAARALAERIISDEDARLVLAVQLEAERNDAARLREQIRRLEAKLSEQRAINEAAIAGRRRFFGPVLMKPVAADWAGEVWLLDPERKERGSGLRFASVAEVRALHPELWIVAITDDGVLLDAWAEAR
jgi:hypothetical protein